MRILFVTASYLPTVNGVSYQISILKKALENLGHKVFVLAPSFPNHKEKDPSIIRYPSIPNPIAKTYPVGVPLVNIQTIKKLKPDIVHTNHPFITGQFASYVSDNLDIPLFFTAHTQYGKYFDEYMPYAKQVTSRFLNSDLKRLSKKCYRIICPSDNIQKKLNKIGIKNTVIINNSIESNFFRKPVFKSHKIPTLVYTGRIDKEKSPMFLIRIAKELKKLIPNFRFLILGEGVLSKKFNEEVAKAKLKDNMILSKNIERSLLPSIYRSAHLFVTASTSEVMPLSVIEGMASGLPTITLTGSGLEDIVLDGKTGYFLPKNPKSVAKKINYLFKNPKVLKKLSLGAYTHSLNFSSIKKSKELVKIYKKSTSGKRDKHKSRGLLGKIL